MLSESRALLIFFFYYFSIIFSLRKSLYEAGRLFNTETQVQIVISVLVRRFLPPPRLHPYIHPLFIFLSLFLHTISIVSLPFPTASLLSPPLPFSLSPLSLSLYLWCFYYLTTSFSTVLYILLLTANRPNTSFETSVYCCWN